VTIGTKINECTGSPGSGELKAMYVSTRIRKNAGSGIHVRNYKETDKNTNIRWERNNALRKGYHKELKLVDSKKFSTGTDDLSLKQSVHTQHFTMVI
jgi:hypothetical protein